MALCYLHNNKNIYFIFRYVDFVKLHSKSHYFIILCAIVLCLAYYAIYVVCGSDIPSQIFLCIASSLYTMVWILKLNKWQIAHQKGCSSGRGSRVAWYLHLARFYDSFNASRRLLAKPFRIPAPVALAYSAYICLALLPSVLFRCILCTERTIRVGA